MKEEEIEIQRKKIKSRINRIAGQVAGIGRMADEDRYCVDILNQISAARAALDALGVELLTGHIKSCLIGHGTDSAHSCAKPMSQDELITEVQTAMRRFLK